MSKFPIRKAMRLQNLVTNWHTLYKETSPTYGVVVDALRKHGAITATDYPVLDHVAFRTFDPSFMHTVLTKVGYVPRSSYLFLEKKVNAKWYAPPLYFFPRVFLSGLDISLLTPLSANIVNTRIQAPVPLEHIDFDSAKDIFDKIWGTSSANPSKLTHGEYVTLGVESEYAAWALYHGLLPNHFALAVHTFKEPYNTVASVNEILKEEGILISNAGDSEIQTSQDGNLLQSATVADTLEVSFCDYDVSAVIPQTYVEFIERGLEKDGIARKEGFDILNASRIFESTDERQVARKT